MKWFDRYSKLRELIKRGRVHTEQRDILTFLSGTISKQDIPAIVVEPAGEYELSESLRVATEKELRVAVSSGLHPVAVKNLSGAMLILTSRMSQPPVFSADKRAVLVDAGLSAEALSIDLKRAQRRWLPLVPVPTGTSLGSLVASGWEGLSLWSVGGTLSHIRSLDWMSYDGRKYSTGSAASGALAPDMLPVLFRGGATLGIITSLELSLQPRPEKKITALFEFSNVGVAENFLSELRNFFWQPETVVYWGAVATDLIRRGNDGTISEAAVATVLVEWNEEFDWPQEWSNFATPLNSELAATSLWADLLRLPRTAARVFPYRAEGRIRVWNSQLETLEQAAREIGRDMNVQMSLWGTVGSGYLHVWALAADSELRTQRRAADAVEKFIRLAASCGSLRVDVPQESVQGVNEYGSESAISAKVAQMLKARCDPHGIAVAAA